MTYAVPLNRPRWNKDAEKRKDLIASLLTEALKDPEILDAWNATFLAFEAATASATDENSSRLRDKGDALGNLLSERAPTLGVLFGPYFARFFLDFMGIPLPEWLPLKIQHLGQDNPLEIAPGGGVLHADDAALSANSLSHFQQLRDYYRSFYPPGQAGRPPANVDLARQASELHLDGKKNIDISWELFPDEDLYDPKVRDRVRQRVRRLVLNGLIQRDRNDRLSESP